MTFAAILLWGDILSSFLDEVPDFVRCRIGVTASDERRDTRDLW